MAASRFWGSGAGRFVLRMMFYGLFTPSAFLRRLTGRDPLGLKAQPGAQSYWVVRGADRPVVLNDAS